MYKFCGVSIFSLSVSCYLLKNLYINYNTYKFLEETISILEKFGLEIDSRKTYSQIFKSINNVGYYNCEFADILSNFEKLKGIDGKILGKVNEIFDNIGKKSSVKEKYFIDNEKTYLIYLSAELKKKLENSRKTTIVMSISCGLFAFIIFI